MPTVDELAAQFGGTEVQDPDELARQFGGVPVEEESENPPVRLDPIVVRESPSMAERLFPDRGETAATMTGALLGGAAGAPLGPVGILGGGVLGAMGGRAGFGAATREPISEQIPEIVGAGREEALFGGGAMLLGPAAPVLKRGVQGALGVGEEAASLTRKSARTGVGLGLSDVSQSGAVKGAPQVVGRVPFLGKPFKVAAQRQRKEFADATTKLLDDIAPHEQLSQLGIDVNQAAINTFDEARSLWSRLYQHADDLAKNLPNPDVVPTDEIGRVAGSSLDDLTRSVRLRSGGELKGRAIDSEVGEFLEGLQDLQDRISVDDLRNIQRKAGRLLDKSDLSNEEIRALTQVKAESKTALQNMDLSQVSADEALEVKRAYDQANKTFAEWMDLFDRPTAKKFTQVDKNRFVAGALRSGAINEDELARTVLNTKSRQAVQDLRKLIGDDNIRRLARTHIENVIESNIRRTGDKVSLNIGQMARQLGFSKGKGIQNEAVEELLKTTGVSASDVKDLFEVGDAIGEIVVPAQLVSRRMTLGGLRSALRVMVPGMAVAAGAGAGAPSLPMAVALYGLVRKGGRLLTDPRKARQVAHLLEGESFVDLKTFAAGTAAAATRDEDPFSIKAMSESQREAANSILRFVNQGDRPTSPTEQTAQ